MRLATSCSLSELSKPAGIGLTVERSMARMSERLTLIWMEGSKALTASCSLSPSSLRIRPVSYTHLTLPTILRV